MFGSFGKGGGVCFEKKRRGEYTWLDEMECVGFGGRGRGNGGTGEEEEGE